jgi:hypothetical protein
MDIVSIKIVGGTNNQHVSQRTSSIPQTPVFDNADVEQTLTHEEADYINVKKNITSNEKMRSTNYHHDPSRDRAKSGVFSVEDVMNLSPTASKVFAKNLNNNSHQKHMS